jgi:ABC-type uncharacterized transport system involved in gliding motility auxiliary subunit
MSRTRSVLASVNFLATALLLWLLFVMVNYIASRRYARWDLTRAKVTQLADQTRQVLRTLSEPVTVVVFYQPSHGLYELVRDLLEEYARVNPERFHVELVDPEQDLARANLLAKQFQIEALNVVVFQSGTRRKHVSDTDLAEFDFSNARETGGQPRVKAFKGEGAFTSALISVTQATAPLIWVTTGHGEKALADSAPSGLADVKRYLEQQNMTVTEATLLEQTAIPSSVQLVLLAGPTRRFADQELALLKTHLEAGGRVLALLDPLHETGLEPLCHAWGIDLGATIVVDPQRQLPFVSAANLFVTSYGAHPIVEKMATLMTLFPLARSVQPATPAPEGVTVAALALTSEGGWAETQTTVETFQFDAGQDLKGPVAIASAAERTAEPKGRLVVIGDSDFAINAQVGNVGNRDFLMGAVYWLTAQEQRIGLSPRVLESVKLNLTARQTTGLFWFSFLALPLASIALGLAMWLIRRQ